MKEANAAHSVQIAMDGPAGAGKSTIAKAVAARLGFTYLDTGAMYRALGLKALRLGVSTGDERAVSGLAGLTDVAVQYQNGAQTVLLDGEDVTSLIRTPEVSMAASDVSRWPEVRARLVALQQAIAGQRSVVMDGRDIGTHVLPGARFKFFVTASVQARARRRQLELAAKGDTRDLDAFIRDIEERDLQDSTRAASPLRVAEGAIVLDTTDMTADEAASYVIWKVEGAI